VKLGLKFDEVRLSDYTPEWKVEFKKVQQDIVKYTSINKNLWFLAQFNLQEVKPFDKDNLLPDSGILYLF
jgi:uncharacterized protein YwqG